MPDTSCGRVIGRYALFDALATGGMATVHFGRLLGPVGFARTVAIKRLHPQYASDPEFVSMFLDEARMCARIRHPNVVPTLDVVATKGELFLVMEYIQGESFGHLVKAALKKNEKIPWRISVSILTGTLQGLHAAHEAKDERGIPLSLVHRDVSPQNILVGVDGMARVVDFGIAKATGRIHVTRENAVKGKLGYMAPEQMSAGILTRQADVYAAAVCLWEALTGKRLFDGESEAIILSRVLSAEIKPPSAFNSEVPPELDAIVLRALDRDVACRHATAKELANALEKVGLAPVSDVGEWVEKTAGTSLEKRAARIAQVETELTPSGALEPLVDDQQPVTNGSGSGQTSQFGSSRSVAETGTSPSNAPFEQISVQRRRRAQWIAGGVVGITALFVIGGYALSSSPKPAVANAQDLGARPTSSAPSAPSATAEATATTATATAVATPAAASAPSTQDPIDLDEASAGAAASASSTPKTWSSASSTWKWPSATASNSSKKKPFDLGGRTN